MTYVDLGYVVALVVLCAYAVSLIGRDRAARRRLGEGRRAWGRPGDGGQVGPGAARRAAR